MSNLTDLLRASTTIRIVRHAVDATTDQTVFTGIPSFEEGHVAVYIEGVRQINTTSNAAYTEQSPDQITLSESVPLNTQVEFVISDDLALIDDTAHWEYDGNGDLRPKV